MPTNDRPIGRVLDALKARGLKPRPNGQGKWRAGCPAHQGDNMQILSIDETSTNDVLLCCHHGGTCSSREIAEALGIPYLELFPSRSSFRRVAKRRKPGPQSKNGRAPKRLSPAHQTPDAAVQCFTKHLGKPSRWWPYYELHDGQSFEILRIYRFDLKDGSKQIRPVHCSADGWRLGDPPGKLPLYALPELSGAETVYVLEGEKCADIARGLGLIATTSSHGSGSAAKTDWRALAGKKVVIAPDYGRAGAGYEEDVAAILWGLEPRPEIKILRLPLHEDGDDIEQWLEGVPDTWDAEDCRAELERLAEICPVWKPPEPEREGKLILVDDGKPNPTELGNARRLVRSKGDSLRFCHDRAVWLIWDDRRWTVDNRAQIWRWAKDVVREIVTDAENSSADEWKQLLKWSLDSQRHKVLKSTIELAATEPEIGVGPEDLDRDPWLLNCLNGTIELKTGELRPHDRADLISKLAVCEYHADAACPRWLEALDTIFAGDEEMIAYLQRALGYSITGDVGEQCLFLCHGSGRNGKSTILDTVRSVLKDYATTVSPRSLLAAGQNDHPAGIADLAGARFVPTSEVNEGERLAEGLIKRLTGDATIKARFMHQNWFEFKINFKLWLAVNSRPEIHGVDEGIWRRIKVIPFEVAIPKKQVVPNLGDLLVREEGPGILAWLVRGCLDWRHNGLCDPPKVLAATSDYRVEEDIVAEFLEEQTIDYRDHPTLCQSARVKCSVLYERFAEWAKSGGERTFLTRRKFGARIAAKGFAEGKTRTERYRLGLAMRDENGQGAENSGENSPY